MRNQGEKKYLKGILKCLVFGIFFLHCSAVWSFTIESYPPEMAPFIPEIENIVNEILAEAWKHLNDPDDIVRRIRALDVTLIKDSNCPSRLLMWTNIYSTLHDVYVCQESIKALLKYQGQEIFIGFAQVLLHELIHRIGYEDECLTTEIELILMNNSPYADHVRHNDYVDECGLSD